MARTDEFKVGQTVRRVSGRNKSTPVGFEGKILRIEHPGDDINEKLWFSDTEWGYNDNPGNWELVGPVRTVTCQEIVPGTYDGVVVGKQIEEPDCDNPDVAPVHKILVTLSGYKDADQLDRAAAVLTALAGALRDGK